MTRLHHGLRRLALRTVAAVMLALGLLAAGGAHASTVDISSVPLTNATASVVKPNLMFILDDSGSMDWDFMPDWVPGGFCRAAARPPGALGGRTDGGFPRRTAWPRYGKQGGIGAGCSGQGGRPSRAHAGEYGRLYAQFWCRHSIADRALGFNEHLRHHEY